MKITLKKKQILDFGFLSADAVANALGSSCLFGIRCEVTATTGSDLVSTTLFLLQFLKEEDDEEEDDNEEEDNEEEDNEEEEEDEVDEDDNEDEGFE